MADEVYKANLFNLINCNTNNYFVTQTFSHTQTWKQLVFRFIRQAHLMDVCNLDARHTKGDLDFPKNAHPRIIRCCMFILTNT